MKIDLPVPFYPNTDDTHCFQAALKMVLKYFQPDKEFSWQQLEKITAKKKGFWTWPQAGMLWMSNYGYRVENIEVFDYQRFVESPEQYLLEFYGEKAGAESIKHSDLPQEIQYAKQLLKANLITKDIPTIDTLSGLLKQGYLSICLVNSQKLNDLQGYVGHFVVVKGITDSELIIHDPGLPPLENRKISFSDFEQAWAVPDEKAKNVMAFKQATG